MWVCVCVYVSMWLCVSMQSGYVDMHLDQQSKGCELKLSHPPCLIETWNFLEYIYSDHAC